MIDVSATLKRYIADSERVSISILEEINYDEISFEVLTRELSITRAKLKTVISTIKQKILTENEKRGLAPAIDKKLIESESKKQKMRIENVEKTKNISTVICPSCTTIIKLERKTMTFAGYNTSANSGVNEGDDFYDYSYHGSCVHCGISFTIKTDLNFDKSASDKAIKLAKKVAKASKAEVKQVAPVVEDEKNNLTLDKNNVSLESIEKPEPKEPVVEEVIILPTLDDIFGF